MKFSITCDANWDSGVDKVLDTLENIGYRAFFEKRSYGASVSEIGIVIMCRNPSLNFKQRVRYYEAGKEIYLDIMLDLDEFVSVELSERVKIV